MRAAASIYRRALYLQASSERGDGEACATGLQSSGQAKPRKPRLRLAYAPLHQTAAPWKTHRGSVHSIPQAKIYRYSRVSKPRSSLPISPPPPRPRPPLVGQTPAQRQRAASPSTLRLLTVPPAPPEETHGTAHREPAAPCFLRQHAQSAATAIVRSLRSLRNPSVDRSLALSLSPCRSLAAGVPTVQYPIIY